MCWSTKGSPGEGRRDEVAFLAGLLDDLGRRYPLDTRRIVASGFSQGGAVVWEFACRGDGRIRAFMPIAGVWWRPMPTECPAPRRPSPQLLACPSYLLSRVIQVEVALWGTRLPAPYPDLPRCARTQGAGGTTPTSPLPPPAPVAGCESTLTALCTIPWSRCLRALPGPSLRMTLVAAASRT